MTLADDALAYLRTAGRTRTREIAEGIGKAGVPPRGHRVVHKALTSLEARGLVTGTRDGPATYWQLKVRK